MNKFSLVFLVVLVAGCCLAEKHTHHRKHSRRMASSEETAISGEASHEQERRNAGMMTSGEASHEQERRNAGMRMSSSDEKTSGDDYEDDYHPRRPAYKKSYYKDEYEKPAYKKEYYIDEHDEEDHEYESPKSYKSSHSSYKKPSYSSHSG